MTRDRSKYWVLGVGYPSLNPEIVELRRQLHILALDQDRTLSELVREALADLLAKHQSDERNDHA